MDFIFEVVRREEDWKERFVDRMKLYKEFYEDFVQFDSGYERPPQIILVAEDEKHMIEIFKEIVTNSIEIKNVKIYFTADLSQNSTKLNKSLVEFGTDSATGKYKMNNIDVKILG